MKSRRLIILSVLLACLVVSSPAFAISIIVPIDPCLSADVVTDIGTIEANVVQSGSDFQVAVYSYDLLASGTTNVVAHVIHHYTRVSVPSLNATLDDTFVDLVHQVTVFGRSVNRNSTGLIGIKGVIVSAVNFDGTANDNIKGRYLITDFGGPPNRFCVFLQ